MSNDLKMEDLVDTASTSEAPTETSQTEEVPQDPLKVELDKVQKKSGKSEAEKARDNLFFNAKRVRELGFDPAEVLGLTKELSISQDESEDDNAPVTLGMLKKIQQDNATKTALQLADEIPNETERELTKHYLQNRVVPSGNPKQDLEDARGIVNSKKNQQILEEIARKNKPKSFSSASSAGISYQKDEEELTREELTLMKFGNLSKEEVLKARGSQQ